jgi:hypothetical protein
LTVLPRPVVGRENSIDRKGAADPMPTTPSQTRSRLHFKKGSLMDSKRKNRTKGTPGVRPEAAEGHTPDRADNSPPAQADGQPTGDGDQAATIPFEETKSAESPAIEKPPTASLAARAKRTRNYTAEGGTRDRQMEVSLRPTPYPRVFFRAWPDREDYWEVAIYRPPSEGDRDRPTFILDPSVADVPFVSDKVKDGLLVPCITTNRKVFIWAFTIPNPDERMAFRIHEPLERVLEVARSEWVAIDWNPLRLLKPRKPITAQPKWPNGQSLDELFSTALRAVYIDSVDHTEIRKLDTIAEEIQRDDT